MEINRDNRKPLNVFALVMINIIAVDSLRTLPIGAEYGYSLVFYYAIAAVVFFIPVSLVAAELSTAIPETGGLYIWVKEAFGRRAGFITIWLQWVYNVVWYPTIMVFVVSALMYLLHPDWAQSKLVLLPTSIVLFWLATILNCFGIRASSVISIFGAIIGTVVPMVVLIVLTSMWIVNGNPLSINFEWHLMLPDWSKSNELVMLGGILFGLIGMEMSAVHAGDVKNPQRDYPKALLWSTIIIFFTLFLGSLAIAVIVPKANLDIVSGLITAFTRLLPAVNHRWLLSTVVLMIFIGAMSSVSTWIMGPARGLLVSAKDGCLPAALSRVNRYGAPIALLIFQALLYTLLCGVYILFDEISLSYWLLSDLTAQLALLVYVFMFAAVIYLRLHRPNMLRPFRIPGGNWVCYMVAGIGIVTCLLVIATGYIPPQKLNVTQKIYYELFLILGMFFFFALPWFLARKHRNLP